MAGDWIKMRSGLHEEAEVFQIMRELDLPDAFAVIGRLHRIWSWADQQTDTGRIQGVTREILDAVSETPGFAAAMEKAHWLKVTRAGITFPNFDRHNSQSAKRRCKDVERKRKSRAKPTTKNPRQYIPADLRRQVYKRDKRRCVYCGWRDGEKAIWGRAINRDTLGLDHVIPICQGGKTTASNLVTVCVGCNRDKNGRTPDEAGMVMKYVTEECDQAVTWCGQKRDQRREEKRREEQDKKRTGLEVADAGKTAIRDMLEMVGIHEPTRTRLTDLPGITVRDVEAEAEQHTGGLLVHRIEERVKKRSAQHQRSHDQSLRIDAKIQARRAAAKQMVADADAGQDEGKRLADEFLQPKEQSDD